MANYTFRTPTVSEGPTGKHRLFYFRHRNVGLSVYKSGGTYKTIRYVQDSFRNEVDEFYGGGHEYTVDDATRTAMIAANIGITADNFTAQ